MTESRPINEAGNALSIAGLVIGIVALLFSFIPYLGMYAVFPGGVAIILSGLGLYFNSKNSSPLGLSIVALCISVLGTTLAAFQYIALTKSLSTVNSTFGGFNTNIQQQVDSLNQTNPEIMLDINEKIDSFIEITERLDTLE